MQMRVFLLVLLSVSLTIYSQKSNTPFYHNTLVAANDVSVSVSNIGSGVGNGWWHVDGGGQVLYDYGPFFVAKTDTGLVWAQNAWNPGYGAGPLKYNIPIRLFLTPESDTLRVHKIELSDSLNYNRDLYTWPADHGAPVFSDGTPLCYATESTWAVYNALDSRKKFSIHPSPQFPLEIHQNIYAYQDNHPDIPIDFLDEIVFFEYTFINKSNVAFDSAYIGFWTDIDFYYGSSLLEEEFAVDIPNQLGYHWTNFYNEYEHEDTTKDPAIGFVQLYGPLQTAPGHEAIISGEKRKDKKNLDLSAFHGVGDDSFPSDHYYSIAQKREHAFLMAQGLDKEGKPVSDPVTGEITTFPFNSNPLTAGIWPDHNKGFGMGFYLFSGPFTMAPGDSNWAMYAFLPVMDGGPRKSITELKRRASELREIDYNNLVIKTPIPTSNKNRKDKSFIPEKFELFQNFPNPFNNTTSIRFDLSEKTEVKLEVFSVLGEIIFEENFNTMNMGKYTYELSMKNFAAGVYLYRMITTNDVSIKKLVYLK
ncbi:MAG: hypothetical protein SCALA702_15740 [Melioribacteraceae bacterium]|nr:MAG: hypothetical protein SCALA702_15740 [Melioribacteraceae bacterium]